ncbi:MAG: DUF5666 domain-containing protein [Acidobacteriota bacterium]
MAKEVMISFIALVVSLVVVRPGFAQEISSPYLDKQEVNSLPMEQTQLAARKKAKKLRQAHFIMGAIQTIDGSMVRVSGTRVLLDLTEAKIKSALTGERLTLDDISVGMQISATLNIPKKSKPSSHPIKARTVFVSNNNQGVMVGELQDVNLTDRSLRLLNHRVFVSEDTIYQGKLNKLGDLKQGNMVMVAVQDTENDLVALNVIKVVKNKNKKKKN